MTEDECIETVDYYDGRGWYYEIPVSGEDELAGPFETRQDAMFNLAWWFA